MRPMLDDIALPQIQTLRVKDSGSLVEHRSPEMDGSYFQNLGRRATTILVAGIASGPEALELLAALTAGDSPEIAAKGMPDPQQIRELISKHS